MTLRPFVFFFFAGSLVVPSRAQDPQLASLLKQMDVASARFKSMQADVRYDEYAKLTGHDLSAGSMYIERAGKTQNMSASITEEGAGSPRIINYSGGALQVYTPGSNQVDIFNAGANQAKYESFLTLGFGGSGNDLAQSWNIHDAGQEVIDGVKTEKLELTSKDPSVAKTFKQVVIWIDPTRGVSLKQIFFQPSGDSRTALYTNIRLNPPKIDRKPYAISKSATKVAH